MTDVTQPIRDALKNFEQLGTILLSTQSAWSQLQGVCNPAAMTALLARLDAAEKMVSTAKEIVRSELDSNGQAEAICLAIDESMKGKP